MGNKKLPDPLPDLWPLLPDRNLSDGASTSTRGVIFCPLSRALQSSEPFLGRLSMEPSRSAQEGMNQMDGTRAPGHLGMQGVPKSSEGSQADPPAGGGTRVASS